VKDCGIFSDLKYIANNYHGVKMKRK